MKISYLIFAFAIVTLLVAVFKIVTSPQRRFEQISGIRLPESAKLVQFRALFDDEGALTTDGGSFFEFKVNRDDLLQLKSKKAPWSPWENSIVPYRLQIGHVPFSEKPAFHSWQANEFETQGKILTIDIENERLRLRIWAF